MGMTSKNKRNKDQKEQEKVRICAYNTLGATLNMVNEMWNLKKCAFYMRKILKAEGHGAGKPPSTVNFRRLHQH